MKTKELIKQLQENDPDGETEVCVHNTPIVYVDNLPAYYDGPLQILFRDPELENKSCYSVVGAKFARSGRKIVIHTWGIDDAVQDDPDLPVEIEDEKGYSKDHPYWEYSYTKRVIGWRKEGRDIEEHIKKLRAEKAEEKANVNK